MKHLRKFNEELDRIVKIHLNITIPTSMVSIAKEFGVTDENMEEVFNNYVQHLLGTIYNTEADDFRRWCEESDNIVDYISEGVTEKAAKIRNKNIDINPDKLDSMRKKIGDHVKSQGCKVKQIGNDFEVHLDDVHIAQIMFRNDKITVRKEGNKFGKDFDYNQLGDVKKELSKIIG